jgi:hypothetical protein
MARQIRQHIAAAIFVFAGDDDAPRRALHARIAETLESPFARLAKASPRSGRITAPEQGRVVAIIELRGSNRSPFS